MSKLTKDFSRWEFECEGKNCCGNSCPMDRQFMKKLQLLRDDVNAIIDVSSGYRCDKHNDEVPGSAKQSKHRLGIAADIMCKSLCIDTFADKAKKYFNGVIIYHNRIHVDDREEIWYEDKRAQK